MNRKYSPEDFRHIVLALKEKIPNVNITTDVMVGFPGETDEEFQESYRFCEEMGFLWIHVFKYSPRKGTPAARFKDQVDPRTKEQRSKELIKLAEIMQKKVFEHFDGEQMSILLEQPINGSPGDMEGLTSNYIPVAVKIESEKSGEIINIKLTGTEGERMRGTIL